MKVCLLALMSVWLIAGDDSVQDKDKAQDKPVELKVGDEAPDFELPGTDDKLHPLSSHRGKNWVVIAWYPMALTPG